LLELARRLLGDVAAGLRADHLRNERRIRVAQGLGDLRDAAALIDDDPQVFASALCNFAHV
jgi:hypothetical protein